MKINNQIKKVLITFSMVSLSLSAVSALAGEVKDSSVKKGIYIGISVGESTLKPHVKTLNGRVSSNSDTAFKVQLGYKIKPKIAVEGFYASLGAAEVEAGSLKGDVKYSLVGISGVFTPKLSTKVTGIGKLDVSNVSNSTSRDINYTKIKGTNIFAGVGLQYHFNNKFSIKGEYEYFDKDIQLMTVGLGWDF